MLSANIANQLRKSIYRREGYRCALCDSARYLQIHHIVARSHGGPDTPQNLICLCSDCHALVHGMDLRGLADAERDGMVDQAIVEYMADLYAEHGYVWNPWNKAPVAIGNNNLVGG